VKKQELEEITQKVAKIEKYFSEDIVPRREQIFGRNL
jgi:hypothetical protein